MELQDETRFTLPDMKNDERCIDIRPASASGSESDNDNGGGPPLSFSINREHHLSQKCNECDSLGCCQVARNENKSLQNASSELEDEEQPPVTWFVTKPDTHHQGGYNQANLYHYGEFDIATQESQLCNLCLVRRKKFYCISCVSKGEFSHSNPCRPGNLAERKDQHSVIKRRTEYMVSEIKRKTSTKVNCQMLGEDIKMCGQRIKYLQILIQKTREKKEKAQKHARKLEALNRAREQRLPLFIDKASKICQYTHKYVSDLEKEKKKVTEKYSYLDVIRRIHIAKLFELIFPVEKVVSSVPNSSISKTSNCSLITNSCDNTAIIESLMAEAMSTSYVHGQGWITLHNDFDDSISNESTESSSCGKENVKHEVERINYMIVAPHLPADGDYSKFPDMVTAANDQVQSIIPMSQEYQTVFPSEMTPTTRGQGLAYELVTEEDISPIHTISAGLMVSKYYSLITRHI